MESLNYLTSTCRYCQYYQPQGRRGGKCQLLSEVPVQGSWKACALAIPVSACWVPAVTAEIAHSLEQMEDRGTVFAVAS